MRSIQMANLALAFLIELAMLFAVGFWGFHATANTSLELVLGLGIPILIAIFWGIFLAPTARRRVPDNVSFALKLALYALATVALIAAGQVVGGIIFGAIAGINTISLELAPPDTNAIFNQRA